MDENTRKKNAFYLSSVMQWQDCRTPDRWIDIEWTYTCKYEKKKKLDKRASSILNVIYSICSNICCMGNDCDVHSLLHSRSTASLLLMEKRTRKNKTNFDWSSRDIKRYSVFRSVFSLLFCVCSCASFHAKRHSLLSMFYRAACITISIVQTQD